MNLNEKHIEYFFALFCESNPEKMYNALMEFDLG